MSKSNKEYLSKLEKIIIANKSNFNFETITSETILTTLKSSDGLRKLCIQLDTAKGGWDVHVFETIGAINSDLIFEFISKDEFSGGETSFMEEIFSMLSTKISQSLDSYLLD